MFLLVDISSFWNFDVTVTILITNQATEILRRMPIEEINSKSILRKNVHTDSWFISQYGLNLYRGCSHNCSYCDGRAEGYFTNADFAKNITVKTNAPELLERELTPSRRKSRLSRAFVLLGGGVNDSYQAIDKKYQLSRKALEVLLRKGFPVHIITKSDLLERDIDLLQEINEKTAVTVSVSLSCANDEIARHFESGAPLPSARLAIVHKLRKLGIHAGVFLMPPIPLITDNVSELERSLGAVSDAGAEYVIFGGMTLKPGRQRDFYYRIAQQFDPNLVRKYNKMYTENSWGNPIDRYQSYLYTNIEQARSKFKIPLRIPESIFKKVLQPYEYLHVVVSQTLYLQRYHNKARTTEKALLSTLNTKFKQLQFSDPYTIRRELASDLPAQWSACLEFRPSKIYTDLLHL